MLRGENRLILPEQRYFAYERAWLREDRLILHEGTLRANLRLCGRYGSAVVKSTDGSINKISAFTGDPLLCSPVLNNRLDLLLHISFFENVILTVLRFWHG
jgi:hypothetical protein